MSGARRFGPRAAVIGAAAAAALLTAACRVGYNPARSPAARSPRGITVEVDWQARTNRPDTDGELLGTDTTGVYLLHRNGVTLYPYGSPVVLRPGDRRPEPLDLRSAGEIDVRVFSQYARYPFGLDAVLLERLLGALELDSVIVRRSP